MLGMMSGSAAGGPLAAISYQHCMVFLGVTMACFAPINFFIKVRGAAPSPFYPACAAVSSDTYH